MIKIIENLTTPGNNKRLHELLLDHPWHHLKNTAYGSFTNNHQLYEASWQQILYNKEPISDLFFLAESLLIAGLYNANLTCSELVRIRAGMMTRTPYTVVHDPHVDWESNHMTALYYVNDADGDTVFYDQVWDEQSNIPSWEWAKTQAFTVQKRICPKADSLVIFNGLQFHSSSTPTNTDHRIVLNFNWKP